MVDNFDVTWPVEAAPQIGRNVGEGNASDEADREMPVEGGRETHLSG